MSQYSMERWYPDNSKKYRLISVGDLWAEQFAIEIDTILSRILKYWKIVIFEISRIF